MERSDRRRLWQDGDYLVQERVSTAKEMFPDDSTTTSENGDMIEQLVDLDPLLFNGVVGSAFTRLSSSELANVSSRRRHGADVYHFREIVSRTCTVVRAYSTDLHETTSDNIPPPQLTDEYLRLEQKLKLGGGPDKIEKIHAQGKLTARERIDLLLDTDTFQQEIGLLVAYDEYDGQAPAAAVVTVVGKDPG